LRPFKAATLMLRRALIVEDHIPEIFDGSLSLANGVNVLEITRRTG
jgi:hypothetical protein